LTDFADGEGEVGVRSAVGRLGAVDGRVDLEPDVEELAGEKVLGVGGEDTAQRRTAAQALEGLGRDEGEERKSREGCEAVTGHDDEESE